MLAVVPQRGSRHLGIRPGRLLLRRAHPQGAAPPRPGHRPPHHPQPRPPGTLGPPSVTAPDPGPARPDGAGTAGSASVTTPNPGPARRRRDRRLGKGEPAAFGPPRAPTLPAREGDGSAGRALPPVRGRQHERAQRQDRGPRDGEAHGARTGPRELGRGRRTRGRRPAGAGRGRRRCGRHRRTGRRGRGCRRRGARRGRRGRRRCAGGRGRRLGRRRGGRPGRRRGADRGARRRGHGRGRGLDRGRGRTRPRARPADHHRGGGLRRRGTGRRARRAGHDRGRRPRERLRVRGVHEPRHRHHQRSGTCQPPEGSLHSSTTKRVRPAGAAR